MEKRILIIIPCYNEASRLPVEEYRTFLKSNSGVTLLFVNDGSTDGTKKVIQSLVSEFPEQSDLKELTKNSGKAEAIREGILSIQEENYDFIGYFDADLATPLEEAQYLAEKGTVDGAKFVLGSRVNLFGSTIIERNIWRHYFGRLFATLICNIFKISIYDTQCGAKIIERNIAKELFEYPFRSRWLFDIELILRLRENTGEKEFSRAMCEIPLRKWTEKGSSKVPWSYIFKLPFEIMALYGRYCKTKK